MRYLSRIAIIIIGLLVFAVFFLVGASVTHILPGILLDITGIDDWEYEIREQSAIYYSDGRKLADLGFKRLYSEDFPAFMKKTVIAVEDRRFYQHSGLDAKSIARAVWKDIQTGSKVEGGSTITQQLARTLFLTGEKTVSRKIKEIAIAVALEEKYSKEAILNMYLNEIYMGRGCSGMACAARSYFAKDTADLNRQEICMLVGMIQAPEFYAPEKNFSGLKERQEVVINLLVEQKQLTADSGKELKQRPLNIKTAEETANKHRYFTDYIVVQLQKKLGTRSVYQSGLKIYTTLDRRMQIKAEDSIKYHAQSLIERGIGAGDIALVSIDTSNGEIKAMAGGVNYQQNQLNMAVIPRQPGSAIKPLYYAAAMNEGLIKPDTVINNKSRYFGEYKPVNYSKAPVKTSVWEALVLSYNVASVEILNKLGVDKAFNYLRKMGITTLQKADKNLALGLGGMAEGISPVEMAAAFTVFPGKGIYNQYYAIKKVEDSTGKLIYRNKEKTRRVISTSTAFTMDDILTDVVRYGTGKSAAIVIKNGGKTGTTSNSKDLWYLGYIRELSTAVWAGNSDSSPVTGNNAYGGTVCGPIWRDYMNGLYYDNILQEKPVPEKAEEPGEEKKEQPDGNENEEIITNTKEEIIPSENKEVIPDNEEEKQRP